MQQTVIRVGNSLAITLPSNFVREQKIRAGQKIVVRQDLEQDSIVVSSSESSRTQAGITPEFLDWLEKFNKRYKTALTELAKK